ncbi:MAG: DUF6101 family protein [Hyphomicrobiales bacterium]
MSWPDNGSKWIERELIVEPRHLPVEYALVEQARDGDSGDIEWTISLTPASVVLKRMSSKVAHLPREIPFADFSDVVLWGALAHNPEGSVMVGLSLYSDEHAVQIPVCITEDTTGLAARWIAWSQALGLRPKVLGAAEDLRDPFHGLARLIAGAAQPRRLPANRLARGAWIQAAEMRGVAQASPEGPRP